MPPIHLRSLSGTGQYHIIQAEIKKRVENGEKVYFRYTENNKDRNGSIGYVKKIVKEWLVLPHPYRQTGNVGDIHSLQLKLAWDDRTNTALTHSENWDVEYLPEYVGPTIWMKTSKTERLPATILPAYDRLGREIAVGDFVSYIKFGNYGATHEFGVVDKIENGFFDGYVSGGGEVPIANVFCRNIALAEEETVQVKKIQRHADIVVIHDDLKQQLMLKKLSIVGRSK